MHLNEKRFNNIDISKGIGIILVMFGHLTSPEQVSRHFVYAFHMPLFFFLSGVFAGRHKNFRTYCCRTFRSLFVPFLAFIFVDSVIKIGMMILKKDVNIMSVLSDAVMSSAGLRFPMPNSPIWFLFVLFAIKILHKAITQIPNKRISDAVIVLFMILSVGFVFVRRYFDLPQQVLCISAIPGFTFYCLGDFLSKGTLSLENIYKTDRHKRTFISILAVAAVVLLAFLAKHNNQVSIMTYDYSNPLLFFINAVLGIFTVIALSCGIGCFESKVLCKIKEFLIFCGRNSIIILLLHYYPSRYIYPVFFQLVDKDEYLYYPLTECILLLVTVLAMIPAIAVFNRYFYFLIGQKKK